MQLFQGTNIQITTTGKSYLGSTIGTDEFKEIIVAKKVEEWSRELKTLAKIAHSQPQSAYCALTQSLKNRWLYLARTTNSISAYLKPIEDTIRYELLPAILGRKHISNDERRLFALPPRLGGLGIDILPKVAKELHHSSKSITEPPQKNILRKEDKESHSAIETQMEDMRKNIKMNNRKNPQEEADKVSSLLNPTTQRGMKLAQEKGLSAWLTTLPIEEHGYALHKGAFQDAIALRYGWRPDAMPSVCVCGKPNDVNHALSHAGKADMSYNVITKSETQPQLFSRKYPMCIVLR